MSDLLSIMSQNNPVALFAAQAFTALVVEGGKLGELERRTIIGRDGNPREVLVPPAEWSRRVARAAEVGAFERKSVDEIVAHILMTPEPVAA